MKHKKDTTNSNRRLTGVEAALRRAAQEAREIAARTGTPLIYSSEGKIKRVWIIRKPPTKPS